MNKLISFAITTILFLSCKTYKPIIAYSHSVDAKTDYSTLDYWAAHPDKIDEADFTPEGDTISNISMLADVFFIHPTTYIGDKGQTNWNADLNDAKLNLKTDNSTIRFQASAFNFAGRIFAPRYRQAHLEAYLTKDKLSSTKAFDLAYSDVLNAFEFYLKYYNKGRPFFIVGHSQGTNHAERLLKEYFEGKALKDKLIVAYLIGMPVSKNSFSDIQPCENRDDIGCFVSWRTFKRGYEFNSQSKAENDIVVTNPLSWSLTDEYVPKSANKGALLRDFKKIYPELVDAQVHNGVLWATKPKFKGSIFFRTKNYHVADINFYYMNIRENTLERLNAFLKNKRFTD